MNLEALIKPCVGRTGTGSKKFDKEIPILCYAEGEVKVISNKEGKEIRSMKQIYVAGDTPVSEMDNVLFEGRETEIQAIGYFYRNGNVDIKVVYL